MLKRRSPLFSALLMLILCASVLVGSTYAQFTDQVVVSGNVITSGNLKASLDYWTKDGEGNGKWAGAENKAIFGYSYWEPGYTDVQYIKIGNTGKLAFQYALSIEPVQQSSGGVNLMDVIDVYYGVLSPEQNMNEVPTDRAAFMDLAATSGLKKIGTLTQLNQLNSYTWGSLSPKGETKACVVLHMQEEAGNEYMGQNAGGGFNLKLTATQYAYEEDAFGKDYDDIQMELFTPISLTINLTENMVADGALLAEQTATDPNTGAAMTVPAGAKIAEGATRLTLNASMMSGTGSNVQLDEGEAMRSYDVHVDGLAADNTMPLQITLPELMDKALNIGNYRVYHVENGATTPMTHVSTAAGAAHNSFTYDPATGDVTLCMATYSEVAVVAEEPKWEGEFNYSWYDISKTEFTIANADQLAGFGAIVGGMAKDENGNAIGQDSFSGKTVKLIADIDLNDAEGETTNKDWIFYPIGYNSSDGKYEKTGVAVTTGFYAFEGTFDGQGHTISNFYHNTWEMKGDHNWYSPEEQYYRDGMGLFGKVYGGTVKNLTVDNFSSDGEIATTGVIAAYADGATFENIAITNCNPRVYNIGNGGIVGCVGWYAKEAGLKTTFTNITVDNTNKISALWGSYDVACGGLVGQYYPTSGQESVGSPKNAGIDFVNCHVSAQMDVYNDVCGNYQYYAYRYAGMIIGSIRENTTNKDGKTIPDMTGISASGCTVNYGDWNDYYYCEFEKNGHPSYSGPDDYKFSRVDKSEIIFDNSGKATGCTHTHSEAENNKAIYLPFHQLFTGYGWGVNSIGLEQYSGITVTDFNLDIEEGDQEKSVEKFKGKVTELANNKEYKLGDIFSFVDNGVELNPDALTVTVTNLGENNPVSATFVRDSENWENGTLTLAGKGKVKITIQDYYFCTPTTITVNVTDRQPEVKFTKLFDKGFLYRVGNKNTVSLGSLFAAKAGATIGTVDVTVETVTGASGIYTSNATWTNGTIQFSDTGVVKVTITDNDYCTPTELYLEVVDAKNVTKVESALSEDIVLLNDSNGEFTVANGHTFHGNGFKVTCSGNGSYRSAAVSYGFVTVENGGILDNVQIICDVFPESYMYTSEMKAGSDGRYPYGYSAVVISGNSTISNSYIYGARNNIQIGEGDVKIENTVTESGSLSNIHIKSSDSSTVTLDNLTTIQYRTESKYDNSKTVLGFGVLVGTNESASNPTIKLTGDLKQYNWVTSADESVSNSYASAAIKQALSVTKYQHKINNTTTVNIGIAYLNEKEAIIDDKRDNKSSIPYEKNDITMKVATASYKGQVYSIVNSGITADSRYDANTDGVIPYTPVECRPIRPSVEYPEYTGTKLVYGYDATEERWLSKLSVDLDSIDGGRYIFKFSDLIVEKYNENLEFKIKDSNGSEVSKDTTKTLTALTTENYTLEIKNQLYNEDGEKSGTQQLNVPFILSATKKSIEPPKFTNAGTATAIRLVEKSGGEWRPAYTVLTGVSVTYWSASESKVKTVDLATLYNSGTIKGNEWTYTCNDYTLTITGGAVHSDGTTITPVVANNTLYFASMNKAFSNKSATSEGTTSRNIILTYVFTDKNASTPWNRNETVNRDDLKEYDYNSFKNNGTLTEPSSGSDGCVTPDTLITLADGSKKEIQYVTYEDELLVWDFFKGEYTVAPAALIVNHGLDNYTVIELMFEDGTTVKAVTAHSFFDADENKFVLINSENAADYVGHRFMKDEGNEVKPVKLVDCKVYEDYTESYTLVSAGHYNFMTEDLFSLTNAFHQMQEGLVVGENLKYDEEVLKADIEKYGLYTYEKYADYITEEQFIAFGGPHLKISVDKGYTTYEYTIDLIKEYLK